MEKYLLEDLASRNFTIKWLEGPQLGTEKKFGQLNATITIIKEMDSVIEDKLNLYIPSSSTFPAIDGVLVIPEAQFIVYVQATVSESHPIKLRYLKEKSYDKLMEKPVFQNYTHILLFIVPDNNYNNFLMQKYYNVNGKVREKTR